MEAAAAVGSRDCSFAIRVSAAIAAPTGNRSPGGGAERPRRQSSAGCSMIPSAAVMGPSLAIRRTLAAPRLTVTSEEGKRAAAAIRVAYGRRSALAKASTEPCEEERDSSVRHSARCAAAVAAAL